LDKYCLAVLAGRLATSLRAQAPVAEEKLLNPDTHFSNQIALAENVPGRGAL